MSEQAQEATADAQVVEVTNSPTSTASATTDAKVESFSADYVEKLRRENAAYRTRATEAEAKVKATEEKDLSDLELARKQAAEAAALAQQHEAALRSERLRGTIERTAARLGFANVDIAARLVAQDAITYDDAGSPANVEALLQAILTDNPYLRGAVQSGATTNAATRGSQAEPPKTHAQRRDEIYGSGANPFDPAVVRASGGGVYAPDPANTTRPGG